MTQHPHNCHEQLLVGLMGVWECLADPMGWQGWKEMAQGTLTTSLGPYVSFYPIFYFILLLLTKLFRYILLLTTTTAWGHHHQRQEQWRWHLPHAYEQSLVGCLMGETNSDRGARLLGDDWGRDETNEGAGQEWHNGSDNEGIMMGRGDEREGRQGEREMMTPAHKAPPTTAMSNCSWGGKECYVSGMGAGWRQGDGGEEGDGGTTSTLRHCHEQLLVGWLQHVNAQEWWETGMGGRETLPRMLMTTQAHPATAASSRQHPSR